MPLVEPAPIPLPDGDVLDPPIAPPVELPVEPPMPLPVVPPVDPPIVPVEPLPMLPADPLVDPPRLLPVEPLVLLPGDTELDEPLPSVPLPVLPLDAPRPWSGCPGGTPVRDAAFSLLPGVRPFARDAALPLLPGDWLCKVSLPCAPVPLVMEPLDPIDPPDVPEPLMPPDMPDPPLAANVNPVTPMAAAIAIANVVFLILNLRTLDVASHSGA